MNNIKNLLLLTFTALILSACAKTTPETPDDLMAPALPTTTEAENDSTVTTEAAVIENDEETENNKEVEGLITFELSGVNYRFIMDGSETPDLRVKLGDRVRINFTSAQGYHDWVVDEFSAATKKVQEGESTSVEFTADQAGTFEYYCSVGQHRANGMRGNLIVEEAPAAE